ncbi:MAG: DNA-protecting protein DprA [Clostridia bacterium]|nr:DNA-protecting protein DprA [Clostridia bacterium]
MLDNVYWAMLHKLWGTKGNKILIQFLQNIQNIKGIDFWQLTEKEICEKFPFISQEMAREFVLGRDKINLDVEKNKINKLNVRIISIKDESYPKLLRHIFNPPPLLYVQGNLEEKNLSIAIVGSRRASPYGKKVAYSFGQQLSEQGVQIISGLARGIDAAGHEGALVGEGGTVAVLGSGLDIIYPRENYNLYKRIINSGKGAVISEFPLGTAPLKLHFPLRNRIISGLAQGILVIEAGAKSGSLITAELGLEQGKDVFAIPGPITSPLNQGSHKLIKEGAKLVENIDDILEEYGQLSLFKNENKKRTIQLTELEKKILDSLCIEPLTIDEIAFKTELSVSSVISTLSLLQIKGLVKETAGRKFMTLN